MLKTGPQKALRRIKTRRLSCHVHVTWLSGLVCRIVREEGKARVESVIA